MSRPEVLNALDSEMRDELGETLQKFDSHDSLRVAVIQGAGGRSFSVGADLKEFARGASEGRYGGQAAFPVPTTGSRRGVFGVGDCGKPVIAAIDGYCLAAGLEVALDCDIRIATVQSTFGLPEPKRGLLADTGLHHLSRVIPLGEALLMQLSGSRISAERAYQIGLIQALADDRDQLTELAESIAREICECSPTAVRAIKQIVKGSRWLPVDEARKFADPYQRAAALGHDAREGTLAFAEKRPPMWAQ